VVIFADDLGYGDLGCFGHPTIRTPNLDRMAAEGMKLTQFYSAAPVCTPSRAALLTGRLPIRNGMCSDRRRVLFPNSGGGLPESEVTIASALKTKGYATCCIGKWHLGHLPEYLPTKRGFDSYYGIPYSNDMRPCPLMENEKVVEQPAKQVTLTKRYTARAIEFIEASKDKPFFLYFPHTFPHVPLFASSRFRGRSPRGLYGDVVEELDWSVGQILDTLGKHKLAEKTLVLFTSDNGPWLIMKLNGGSAGLLRGGKGSTWEGGMREPCIAWWPGKIRPASLGTGIASTMDIFATCLDLAGVPLPSDRIIDGRSMMPMLLGTGKAPREAFFFYRGARLMAVRKGPWKAHFITQAGYRQRPTKHDPPLLFHLDRDPSEKLPVKKPPVRVLADIQAEVAEHKAKLKPPPSQLERPIRKPL
jgi:arylsulfatase A-like enzyme